jgi:hypothetical protein
MKKMWHLYTVEFCPGTKKNEILSLAGKWMELENIMLSEVIQVQKDKGCHVFSHVWNTDPIQMQEMLWKTGHAKGRLHMREGG